MAYKDLTDRPTSSNARVPGPSNRGDAAVPNGQSHLNIWAEALSFQTSSLQTLHSTSRLMTPRVFTELTILRNTVGLSRLPEKRVDIFLSVDPATLWLFFK
jgi:hypothetical protein